MIPRLQNPKCTLKIFFNKSFYFLKILINQTTPGLSYGTQESSNFTGACEIQFPDQGSKPGPSHWECGALTTGGPPGKSPQNAFHSYIYLTSQKCYIHKILFLHNSAVPKAVSLSPSVFLTYLIYTNGLKYKLQVDNSKISISQTDLFADLFLTSLKFSRECHTSIFTPGQLFPPQSLMIIQ